MIETLEIRRLLAGNVTAALTDGFLILNGDDEGNGVVIERVTPVAGDDTTLRITPVDDTTVNDSGGSVSFAGVQSLALNMVGGDDSVLLRDARIRGRLTFDGGEGRDVLTLRRVTVYNGLYLSGGAGRDAVHLANVRSRASLAVNDWAGPSSISFDRRWCDGTATVRTGNSIDHLNITGSTFRALSGFRTLGGDDTITIRGTTIPTGSTVDAGEGDNTVDRQIIMHWDFRNGEQGWRAGFADISVSDEDLRYPELSPTPEVQEVYRLRFGTEALQDELGINGTGYVMSGSNLSDDMFMYLSRGLSGEHGVVAGQRYEAEFTVRFASDAPEGSVGAGGPPTSVYVKVGAVPRRPRIELLDAERNFVGVNVDKGIQANSGSELSIAGDVANDLTDRFEYRVVSRRHTHPQPAAATADGRLWLVVGTDSAFEGITTLYYMAITVTLTPVWF